VHRNRKHAQRRLHSLLRAEVFNTLHSLYSMPDANLYTSMLASKI
jgi:hypothetical protein